MKVLWTRTAGGTYDVTEWISVLQWSGDYKSCCRQAEITMLAPGKDPTLPELVPEPGDLVQILGESGQEIFRGIVFRRSRDTGNASISMTALDRGVYLKQNQTYAKYKNMTPEGIAAQLCGEFGIPVGTLAAAGHSLTRTFFGTSLYDIIMTAYTMAGQKSGAKYLVRFEGDRLCVVERKISGSTLVLEGGVNLMTASVDENAMNLVNRVKIVSDNHAVVDTVEDGEGIAAFGAFQRIIRDGENAADQAADALRGGALQQKITLEALGDIRCIAGNMVVIHEPVTGLFGAYHIDGDTHAWKRGIHTMKLQLNFDAVMDEKEAGSLEKADTTGGRRRKGGSLTFIYKPAGEDGGGGMERV